MDYVERGKQEGGKLLAGGARHGEKGYFIAPTVFADVKDDSCINQEEVFGPFVVFSKFKTEEEALKKCMDHDLSVVHTIDLAQSERNHLRPRRCCFYKGHHTWT